MLVHVVNFDMNVKHMLYFTNACCQQSKVGFGAAKITDKKPFDLNNNNILVLKVTHTTSS